MKEFLQHTRIIDWLTPEISALAKELANGIHGDEAVARRSFLWVRDQVRHSRDHRIPVVTCAASEVLQHRAGYCYAKSHLLAALLRAQNIPAALCYQRLAMDDAGTSFCLHGMVAVHLKNHGWYRVDPRGDRPGCTTDFCPPIERLAFVPRLPGEADIPGRFADALPEVVDVLRRCRTEEEVFQQLPDYAPGPATV